MLWSMESRGVRHGLATEQQRNHAKPLQMLNKMKINRAQQSSANGSAGSSTDQAKSCARPALNPVALPTHAHPHAHEEAKINQWKELPVRNLKMNKASCLEAIQ